MAIALGPIVVLAVAGQIRLATAPQTFVPGVKIRIVQPSVPQREKWLPENQRRIFFDHMELSAANPAGETDNLARITHVIWPEAAMPFLPLDYPDVRAAIGRLLPEKTYLITGALRAEPAPAGASRPRRVFNSLIVFGQGGSLVTLYDKIHLVPFGEYLPLQRQLEAIGLEQLSRLRGGFDTGVTPRPLLARAGPAGRSAPDLLRGDLPARRRARGGAPGADDQPHQRRLVRQYHGAAPAPAPGPRACGGGRVAAHACREQWYFRRHRRLRPNIGTAQPQRAWCDRCGAAGGGGTNIVYVLGRLDISLALAAVAAAAIWGASANPVSSVAGCRPWGPGG